jgi:tRNA pseudouridine synthase 10
MLGDGRPFVIEVKKPKNRFTSLQDLTQSINKQAQDKLEVLNLGLADKDDVKELKKSEAAEKVYRVIVEFEKSVFDEVLDALKRALTDTLIRQETPSRVLHRRADRTREKYIYTTKIKRLLSNRVEMRIHCQGGLYIKELVTGDGGRTDPSVAKIVGLKATPLELDVLKVRS